MKSVFTRAGSGRAFDVVRDLALEREEAWRARWEAVPLAAKTGRAALLGNNAMPGEDHPVFWKLAGEYPAMTFHPYALRGDCLRDLVERCHQRRLHLSIHPDDFYYPGKTLLVMLIKERDLDAFEKRIR